MARASRSPCPPSTLTAAPSGSLAPPLILRFLPSIKPPPGLLNLASRRSCLQTRPLPLLTARPLATLRRQPWLATSALPPPPSSGLHRWVLQIS
uniref:Uncharacterized protein n=1 Tax=Oryza punctata TaxID=4537 RepID=A0A0E0L533_ORYPU